MTIGKVWLVGAGPGEPGLITVKGREVLGEAEVVLHDALAHSALLEACPQAELVDVGKQYGKPSAVQDQIIDTLLRLARAGKRVVRLKGGDPFLFARGAEEALALANANIPFEIVPGVSSPVGTTAYAGIPLTHRTLSSSVLFLTGSDRQGVEWSRESMQSRANAADTLCIVMGMRRIEAITEALISGGREPTAPAAVVQWGARPRQQVATGTLATIATEARRQGLTNPAVIVIGEVVQLREQLRWYDAQPLFGKRILVPRASAQATATARAIRARGAEAICAPAIEFQPPPDRARFEQALRELGSYQWVVFTSANGVEQSFIGLQQLGLDARAFGSAKVAVIGPKTSACLTARGIMADITAEQFVGEAVAEAILASGPVSRVLILRALEARTALPDRLREAGAHVDVVAAYRTEPVTGVALGKLKEACSPESIDAILFTSSSTVTSVMNALGDGALDAMGRITIGSIGPVTTKTAEAMGIEVDVTANEYTVDGLLAALERHYHSA